MSEFIKSAPSGQRISSSVISGAIFVMFLWALCFPLINIGLKSSPPMTFATLRALLSGIALLVIAQYLGRPAIEGQQNWWSILLVGLTATTMGFIGMFYGGTYISPGLATVVANTQPLLAAILAWWVLGELLKPIQRWGLAVGFFGIVMIGMPNITGSHTQWLGFGLILVGALGVAISNVTLKFLADRVDPLRVMGWQLIIGSIPLALIALSTEDVSSLSWSLVFVINLLVLSLLGTSLAFVLWFSLLRRAKLSELNVFTFLTPIFGLIIGAIFFSEKFHVLEIVGIALSMLGIYWVSRSTRARASSSSLLTVEED